MCQAYESEARLMSSLEDGAARRGFEDRLNGKPFDQSPGIFRDSYRHGWGCVDEGILPYGVEQQLNLSRYDALFTCPVCGEVIKRYAKKSNGDSHNFGYPCDGSNPLEHQRKSFRRARYEELKAEFGAEERGER